MYRHVNLLENVAPLHDPALMPHRKDVFVVVFELLATNSTHDMLGARTRLLDIHGILFIMSQRAALAQQIFVVFLVEKARVLVCKLLLSHQLKYRGAQRCTHVQLWIVVLANALERAQTIAELQLLLTCVTLKVVDFRSVLFRIWGDATAYHVSSLGAHTEARNAKHGCSRFLLDSLAQAHGHLVELRDGERLSTGASACLTLGPWCPVHIQFKPPLYVPLEPLTQPAVTEALSHF